MTLHDSMREALRTAPGRRLTPRNVTTILPALSGGEAPQRSQWRPAEWCASPALIGTSS